jgi:hypothetical protein
VTVRAATVDRLREALVSVAQRLEAALPDFMPISLGYGEHLKACP